MKVATISSKGQITIPKDIQKVLNLTSGSKVMLSSDQNGLLIKPLKTSIVEQTAGSLQKYIAKDKLGVPFREVRKKTQQLTAEELAKKYE